MPIAPQQIGLLQTNLQKAVLVAGVAVDLLYDRLIESCPKRVLVRFTLQVKAAWTKAYAALAGMMTTALWRAAINALIFGTLENQSDADGHWAFGAFDDAATTKIGL